MDGVPQPPPVTHFVPDRRYTALAAAGALVAAVALALTTDAPGRVLAGAALLVLAAYVGCDLVFSPRLSVCADGLVLRAPLTRARLPWSAVEDVRVDTRARYGLRSTTLEIDAGPLLAVLSRRALGADPRQVVELVAALRPR